MPQSRFRFSFKLLKMLLPILLVLVVATVCAGLWLVKSAAHPPHHPYLVKPEQFANLSARGSKVTEETWPNRDGTQARGWLLRGAEGAPAVIFLHSYGADRSWLLNLGVKLNEATNFTVLWPDLRGHGENPSIAWTSFGAMETDDTVAALEYLRSLKTGQERPLVGERKGIYGVELGGYAALLTATSEQEVRALVLDSVPASRDALIQFLVSERTGFDNAVLRGVERLGARLYFTGSYENRQSCAAASSLSETRVLLLSGNAPVALRDSTNALAGCFPNPSNVEVKSDLPLTGYNISAANGQQSEAYDRRVINFLDTNLRVAK